MEGEARERTELRSVVSALLVVEETAEGAGGFSTFGNTKFRHVCSLEWVRLKQGLI